MVHDVDLRIEPGETVALVGSTGAGKSTLAKLIARFYDPREGQVLIDGHDLRDVSIRSLRDQLAIVPQEGHLFAGTIAENLAFGRPEATDAELRAAADAVGATGFIEALPDGFDTRINERGSGLSAGQRQLISFARALVADPRLLILDEATSSVDLRAEHRIDEALRTLLAGRTAIVIAHRLSTIRDADRIVVLEGGRIVEQGSHDELLRRRRPLRGALRRLGSAAAAGVSRLKRPGGRLVPSSGARPVVGDRLAVGRRVLAPVAGVRILLPQLSTAPAGGQRGAFV